MPRKKVWELRFLLVKEGIKRAEQMLRSGAALRTHHLAARVPFEGALYVGPVHASPPKWVPFVQQGTSDVVDPGDNASTAGVVLFRARDRWFALHFGQGRNLLNADAFVRDFGLKVVLNTAEDDSLRSLDARTIEEMTLVTRKQLSRGAGIEAFGINPTQDLLRAVAGKPKTLRAPGPDGQVVDRSIGRRMAGSDGLMLATTTEFTELGLLGEELLDAYGSTAYQERYAFIDHLKAERDEAVTSPLNQRLIEKLRSGDLDGVHMMPPEPVNLENASFSFTPTAPEQPLDDLEMSEFLETVDQRHVTVEVLKSHRVYLHHSDGSGRGADKWSVYNCIVAELPQDGVLFTLSEGVWFRVATEFVSQVDEAVAPLVASCGLPAARQREREKDYNLRAGRDLGYVVFDCKCPRVGGSPIEPCDLFSPDQEFIHVKKRSKAANLSHLFQQGLGAAECFIGDKKFRASCRSKVGDEQAALRECFPDERPRGSDYKVTFAIISKDEEDWPRSLPFLSRLSIMNVANRLQIMGFSVSLVRVPVVGAAAAE
ncbi:MAG: TIGR04141 family sporadically distributed protein [Armatimonadetes bacterium]|nr:TIGR04141 family sporadically distributed protein [Armatimonadota bacterium]